MKRRARRASDRHAIDRAENTLGALVDGNGHHKDDESARMYSEALGTLRRTRAILEGVGDGVFVTDEAGTVRLWNTAAERLIDRPEHRALGRNCAKVLGFQRKEEPLDCSKGCALLRELARHGLGASAEVSRFRPGARLQDLLVSVAPVTGPDGEVTEVVHSMRDITALKLADEAKTMFLATASHELKTPLTVILGFAQSLASGWLEEKERDQAIRSIETRARELSRIVDRLLLTGRIEAGRVRLELGTIPVRALLRERVESLAGATGRRITCEAPADLPPVVADDGALTTAIDHILDNAVKYSPDGGDIVVHAYAEGSSVVIDVTDPGIGMNADEAAHAFDRFWQAEQSDVRRFGGTGIGLYIVKSLVEGMNGSVGVRSAVGKGSTFTIKMRRAEDQTPAAFRVEPGKGPRSMIQEFMRQLGVPNAGGGGGGS